MFGSDVYLSIKSHHSMSPIFCLHDLTGKLKAPNPRHWCTLRGPDCRFSCWPGQGLGESVQFLHHLHHCFEKAVLSAEVRCGKAGATTFPALTSEPSVDVEPTVVRGKRLVVRHNTASSSGIAESSCSCAKSFGSV